MAQTADIKTYQQVIEAIFEHPLAIKNIISCSPECCPICYRDSTCDGSDDYCKKYHLENVSRILNNIQKQHE